jgi:hypothetical protein
MKTTFSFSLQKLEGADDVYRGYVWKTLSMVQRPVTLVVDIAEGTLADINLWLCEEYPFVTHVKHADGTLEEPDCLTVYEAAESMAL